MDKTIKKRLIGRIFKILPMKEAFDKDELSLEEAKSYISKQYIYFSGIDIDDDIRSEITIVLKGIKNTYDELSCKEIHNIVLRLTNLMDRGL